MKVAIDSGPVKGGDKIRGIGFHTRTLIDHLKNIKDLLIDVVDTRKTDLTKFDLVHYPKFNPYKLSLPYSLPKRSVLTIHDLIYLVYPAKYPAGIRGQFIYWLQKQLAKKVDAIITISETSKADICKYLGVKPDKVGVIYLAPREVFQKITDKALLIKVKNKYHLPDKFALYVGDVNYNKNVLTLIKACEQINIPLVLVGATGIDSWDMGLGSLNGPRDWIRFILGKPHPEAKHFRQLSELISKSKQIIRVGKHNDQDLVAIFNLATVYCQPSYYEGFSLPIVEAMASGTPVVASDIKVHREIYKNACLYFDPESVSDLQQKLKTVLSDTKLQLKYSQLGLQKASQFSWDQTARQTYQVYEKVYKLR